VAGIDISSWPKGTEASLANDGREFATRVCGNQERSPAMNREHWCGQRRERENLQEAGQSLHWPRETEAAREESLHVTPKPKEAAKVAHQSEDMDI
jgi:hypothetical protein